MKQIVLLVLASLVLANCPKPPSGTAYFLVSEINPVLGDSYVLPLTDQGDIAHARMLASGLTTSEPLVTAQIAEGGSEGDYINRDMLDGGTPWSWRVTQFLSFADAIVEIYDGSPSYVEDNLDWWMNNTGGTIGFWNYTVTRELTPEEVQSGVLN